MTELCWNKNQDSRGSSVTAEIWWPWPEMNSCPAQLIAPIVSKARIEKRYVLEISAYYVSLLWAAVSAAAAVEEDTDKYKTQPDDNIPCGASTFAPWYRGLSVRTFSIQPGQSVWFFEWRDAGHGKSSPDEIVEIVVALSPAGFSLRYSLIIIIMVNAILFRVNYKNWHMTHILELQDQVTKSSCYWPKLRTRSWFYFEHCMPRCKPEINICNLLSRRRYSITGFQDWTTKLFHLIRFQIYIHI